MLKSLVLSDSPRYFDQAIGPCYHYSPTTAALLYEVTPLYHRGSGRYGHSQAKSEAMTAKELTGTIRTAALAHVVAGVTQAALYTANEQGEYEWQQREELPWAGLPTTAAIVHVRYLPCPLRAFFINQPPTDHKITNMRFNDFILFLQEWIEQQPYYFPALRRAERAASGLAWAISHSPPYLTTDSLPSFACYAFFREVGNVRRPSPDLFDRDGNVIPSKTRINPESTVMRGSRNEKRRHIPRAQIVWDLFTNGKRTGDNWARLDGNPSNDRIENLYYPGLRHQHANQYEESERAKDAVFPYRKQLPTSLYLSRGWRYGIERLAFDIDEVLL